MPDALIIATAEAVEADALLATDRQWKEVSSIVSVIEPTEA
jgi:predicted nucleic acid-binding protein